MTDDKTPRSEPLGTRRATGDANGWNYFRHSTAMKKINTAQVPQEQLGDPERGKKA